MQGIWFLILLAVLVSVTAVGIEVLVGKITSAQESALTVRANWNGEEGADDCYDCVPGKPEVSGRRRRCRLEDFERDGDAFRIILDGGTYIKVDPNTTVEELSNFISLIGGGKND